MIRTWVLCCVLLPALVFGIGSVQRLPAGQEVTPADDLAIAEVKTLKIWPTFSRSPGVPLNPGPRRPTITCCPASIASTAWT
jgi:hypothetical protein